MFGFGINAQVVSLVNKHHPPVNQVIFLDSYYETNESSSDTTVRLSTHRIEEPQQDSELLQRSKVHVL
jgi:hypothetical protein